MNGTTDDLALDWLIAPFDQPGATAEPPSAALVLAGQPVAKFPPRHEDEPAPQFSLSNLKLDDDGRTVLAEISGILRISAGKIAVEPLDEIAGNVDVAKGNVESATNTIVRGNVSDLMVLTAAESILVGGTIEAAQVRAGKNLQALGGIAGREKGTCFAGASIWTKYIGGATINAEHDVFVQTEINSSRIICGGKLCLEGAILASHVTANGSIQCATAGSLASVKTILEAGVDQKLLDLCASEIPTIKNLLARAKNVRQTIKPLMADPKRLTVQQKEKATELLFQADELECEAKKKIDLINAAEKRSAERSDTRIIIGRTLFPGTTLRLGNVEREFDQPMQGPVTFTAKRHGGAMQITTLNRQGEPLYWGGRVIPGASVELLNNTLKKAG
jgi:uncharacterized protein